MSERVVEEPSAAMRQMARALRDMFVALRAEGFTPGEAMQIIGHALAATIGGGK